MHVQVCVFIGGWQPKLVSANGGLCEGGGSLSSSPMMNGGQLPKCVPVFTLVCMCVHACMHVCVWRETL